MTLSGSYLFTNELLPQELPGLKHVGDVIEGTEAFVFVLVLLLKRLINDEGGQDQDAGRTGENENRKKDGEGESYSYCTFYNLS